MDEATVRKLLEEAAEELQGENSLGALQAEEGELTCPWCQEAAEVPSASQRALRGVVAYMKERGYRFTDRVLAASLTQVLPFLNPQGEEVLVVSFHPQQAFTIPAGVGFPREAALPWAEAERLAPQEAD